MVGMRSAILFFLLTLQTEIVVAADGDLNAACVSGTTCTPTDNVCDPVDTKCRKKSGVACNSSDATVGCVTDATCTSGTCTCPSATHIVSGGLCKLKVDEKCSSATAKCVANATCPSDGGVCACNTSYVARSDKTACLLKAGQTCTADADCTANSACSNATLKKCTCSANYVEQVTGLCSEDNKYGGTCTAPVGGTDSCVANDANSKCSGATGTCGCKPGFTASIGTLCSGAIELTGSIFFLIGVLLLKTNLL